MQVQPAANDYDVVVIGGGPAGSTAATLVAQHGHRVLLLDRESFPRFRIGESLMPATYWTLQRLGVLDRMKRSSFPKKYSVQFFSGTGRSTVPFYFSEFDPHESSQTWQVDRLEFDTMLLYNARQTGVEVVEGANVRDVLQDGARVTGVRAEYDGDGSGDIRSKVVVDATGQSGFLSRRFGLRVVDDKLRHASYYTRYRGARLDAGRDAGATLIYWTRDETTWFWFIPLPGGLTSVGVVGPVGVLSGPADGGGADPQQVYDAQLRACPTLMERLEGAEQTDDVRVIRDFSYVSRKIAGDGWVMAGDAFGFLDPIYSSGVFLALKSAEFAADAIVDGLARDDLSASQLGRHGDEFLAGMESLRRLVYAYYDRNFHFKNFLNKHPDCREPLIDLLVGNVFRKPVHGLFEAMSDLCPLPEARTLDRVGEAR